MKGSGVFTLRSFHASTGPPPDLNAFTCPNCTNKVDKDRTYDVKYKHILPYFKGNEGVPAIFLEYYPKISVADFRLMMKDAQFLERKARVCDSCYIDFTQVLQSGGKKKNQVSPKLSRSISSTGNTARPLSPMSDKFSNGSGSPPSSPLFTHSPKAPPLFKSSPPPSRGNSSSLNSTPNSSSSSISPSSSPTHSLPPSHNHSSSGLSKRVQKNGNYKDSYYLSLYEELDSLRKELHDLKTQEESSADQLNQQLKEKDEELKAQKKVQATKMRQETQQKDEQIKDLQTTIANMQRDHAAALEAVEREFEKKLECKVAPLQQKQEQLEATIAKLTQEKDDVIKQSATKIETDRSTVLAEVEKLKQKFDMEKVVEKEQLRTKFKEDLEISKKKNEERTTILRQQVTDLETQLAEEKKEKEKAIEEKRELTKQLELAKAKSRVEGKA